jgi:hypothetical protein
MYKSCASFHCLGSRFEDSEWCLKCGLRLGNINIDALINYNLVDFPKKEVLELPIKYLLPLIDKGILPLLK